MGTKQETKKELPPEWNGLKRVQLLQIERAICAPTAWAGTTKGCTDPLDRCGLVLDWIHRQIRTLDKSLPLNNDPLRLAMANVGIDLGGADTFNKFLKGELHPDQKRNEWWEEAKRMLAFLLLGKPTTSGNGEELATADRILDWFFGQFNGKDFTPETFKPGFENHFALTLPYEMLHFYHRVTDKKKIVMDVASGGWRFSQPYENKKGLNMGQATFVLLAGGSETRFYCPGKNSKAYYSAQEFRNRIESDLDLKLYQKWDCIADLKISLEGIRNTILNGLKLIIIDPREDLGENMWGGEFLCPIIRFGHWKDTSDGGKLRKFLLVVGDDNINVEHPECSQAFENWSAKAFDKATKLGQVKSGVEAW